MKPERTATICGHKIEEFYLAGSLAVYIDEQCTVESFNTACARVNIDCLREARKALKKVAYICENMISDEKELGEQLEIVARTNLAGEQQERESGGKDE